MAYIYKHFKTKFFELLPILLLFFISLNGNSIIDFKFFSINAHYILVYFWILRQPQLLSYGLIFLSGIISDVVFGLPLGVNALSLLIIAAVAAYVRVVTVRITLINDLISFIPALLIANFIYFFSSRVLLISDLNSKIPVITAPSAHHAILSGHGIKNPTLEYLPENNNIQDGDKVYISGKEGIFSPGIPIGEVKIENDIIKVLLFSDLSQITFINVSAGDLEKGK